MGAGQSSHCTGRLQTWFVHAGSHETSKFNVHHSPAMGPYNQATVPDICKRCLCMQEDTKLSNTINNSHKKWGPDNQATVPTICDRGDFVQEDIKLPSAMYNILLPWGPDNQATVPAICTRGFFMQEVMKLPKSMYNNPEVAVSGGCCDTYLSLFLIATAQTVCDKEHNIIIPVSVR